MSMLRACVTKQREASVLLSRRLRIGTCYRSFHSSNKASSSAIANSLRPSACYWQAPTVGYLVGCWKLSAAQCDSAALVASVPDHKVPATTSELIAQEEGFQKFRRKVRRAWKMLLRVIKLCFTLAPVAAFYPVLMLAHKRPEDEDAQNIVLHHHDEPVEGLLGWYLRLCLLCVERSGAAVIKLMQWAGSRPDLFGHEFCAIFSKLQDDTTPHRWKHTEQVLREAFGDDWKDKIELEEILGSGCIGQVYRGQVVSETGEKQKVAVKVLHPNVEEDIDADLDLMRVAVRATKYMPFDVFANLKWLNMEGVVEEFAALLKLQLDLRTEAANLNRFNENFKDEEFVVFPEPVKGFEPTQHVLVETFCEGVPVLQWAREHKDDRELLHMMCRKAVEAVCRMIFTDNFMHGDLHPGNVFISPDGKQFILFDVGIVAEYSDRDHEAIVDILSAFIRKQGRRAGRLMIDDSNSRLRAAETGDYVLHEEKYIDKIESLTIKASGKDYLMEHLGTYITFICDAAAEHHVMMNPAFISAALAVKVEEGIALALDPSIQIWKVATPIIIESQRQREGLVKGASRILGVKEKLDSFIGRDDERR